ncbi:DNA replication protein [Peribacillus huizhouensis]|uniref:DNA replication protein DnaC n=1 Tax=Peribacillus huizhouensis TaxID=1501239 RepID=A0ABR6CRC0_9BACI|nr:DNA replication protein [Peribacillus huizhouensis]MBA9027578.1 DNA replication protein DnaC [Peribacillus huizhouensis]
MSNETNEKRCLLAEKCTLAGGAQCTNQCGAYIACHGRSGEGGRVGAAGLPRDYRLVTLKNSPARADQAEVYRAIDAYVATFERQFEDGAARIKSLYLVSESPGTGKTTTASAILNEWLKVHYIGSLQRDRQAEQRPAYFLDVNNWQTDYNNFNRPKVPDAIAEPAAKRYYTAMEHAKHAPMAILDDIGVRDCSDGFRADLHAIINHRVTNAKPTIYTSNLPIVYVDPKGKPKIATLMPYDLIDVFGEKRLADRMRDQCAVLSFAGESKRGRR